MGEITTQERFVCGTTVLNEYLLELGFELSSDKGGKGSGRVRIYTLKNKKVIDTHHKITLQTEKAKEKPIVEYSGYTVSKDLLTFFAQRQLEEIKWNPFIKYVQPA